ncbi:hypothetical protein ABEB36_004704, partial [Hypothenemus hampei]
MEKEDFKDFETCAKDLSFHKVPFSKVAVLRFTQNPAEIEFKLKHVDEFVKENLKPHRAAARR